MQLMKELSLSRKDGTRKAKTGATCSGERSTGSAAEWELCLPDRPTLTVRDTKWDNGERDLVLYQPSVVPEMPSALSNLHNRLRSGIAPRGPHGELRLMLYPTHIGDLEWPKASRSVTTKALTRQVGLDGLRELTTRQGVTLRHGSGKEALVDLENPREERGFQHALFFPPSDEETPVIAFVHFRIVPVLRHIGWLSRDEN